MNALTAKYTLMQGAYWMICCSVSGYSTVFLVSRGFSAGTVGMLIAWASILAAFLQPMVASLADRSQRVSLRGLLLSIPLAGLFPALILVFLHSSGIVTTALYMIVYTVMLILQPLVNAMGMRFPGEALNFGLARGLGSLCYALFSTLLGLLTKWTGEWCVPFSSAVLFLLLLLFSRLLRPAQNTPSPDAEPAHTSAGFIPFLRRYPAFLGVLAGTVFLFSFHSIVNTYLFQISTFLGGDSSTMGAALSIGAVCELPVMFGFSRIVRRFPIHTLLRVSAFFFVLKASAFLLSGNMTGVFFSMTLQCLSFALFIPASVYYADSMTKEEDKVMGQAVMTAALTVGGVLGNLCGGWVYDFAGTRALLLLGTAFAAAGAALIFLFTARRGTAGA